MTFAVIIEQQAASDIAAYAQWVIAEGSPQNAARWVNEIEAAIASLATMPQRCALAPEASLLGRPILQLMFKSHRVLFIIERQRVHILHVRHGARLPLTPDDSP